VDWNPNQLAEAFDPNAKIVVKHSFYLMFEERLSCDAASMRFPPSGDLLRMSQNGQFPTLDGREEGVTEPFCLWNWMDVASPTVNATYMAAGLTGRRFCRPLAAWAQAGA